MNLNFIDFMIFRVLNLHPYFTAKEITWKWGGKSPYVRNYSTNSKLPTFTVFDPNPMADPHPCFYQFIESASWQAKEEKEKAEK